MADCTHEHVQVVRACSLRREGPGLPPIVQATCTDCGAVASTLPPQEATDGR